MKEIFQIHINDIAVVSFFNYNDLESFAAANNLNNFSATEYVDSKNQLIRVKNCWLDNEG